MLRRRLPLMLFLLVLAACQTATPATPTIPAWTPTRPNLTPSPEPRIFTPTPTEPRSYPTPRLTPVTAIPAPLEGIHQPPEVKVLLLLGSDLPAPFVGRTDAVMLVFFHPRLGKASLLSLPPDLILYLPGYTMQRLNIAYAVGGIRQVNDALAYNLGVRADHWLLAGLDDIVRLVDDLGGLDLNIVQNYPTACGGIPAGPVYMNGIQTLCFIRFRFGMDEADRSLRQQEAFRQILRRMVVGGRLVTLPLLFEKYRDSVSSNLTLEQVVGYTALILKLGDPGRIGFFHLDEEDVTPWQFPGELQPQVLLPDAQKLKERVQAAIDFVLTPAPYSEVFATLEAELTTSPTPTGTLPATPTSIPPPTGTVTRTPTISATPTAGPSPTASHTPTPGDSPTPSATVVYP